MKPHQVVVPLCIAAALSIASLAPASAAIHPRDAHAPATGFPQVMLGYAAGKTVNFPDPWANSKHVTFIGATNGPKPKGPKGGPESGRWDTSGIELINPGKGALHVASVRVRFSVGKRKLSPWGAFDVTGKKAVILASTNSSHGGNFDGSEHHIPGVACNTVATTDAPRIRITMSDGTHEVLIDSGHVLDAGGFNPGHCNEAESQSWRAVGAIAGPFS